MAATPQTAFLQTPIGILKITGTATGIASVEFVEEENVPEQQEIPECLQTCVQQLQEYFRKERQEFSLQLNPAGTAFQQRVWAELQQLPYGQTCSYAAIAGRLGDGKAVRAVGAANGKNPIAIIIPCHRVVGQNGSLTGYAGGLSRKHWLLQHEQAHRQTRLF